jgi:SagB-type dehydrogenase family enzyme
MKALELRRTKRKLRDMEISLQDMSNLLWAACGVTLKETKKTKSRRTAPSACNSQEIKVYVALPYGLFLYVENSHTLEEILSKDIRENVGTQKMMKNAPLALIYVSDYSKFNPFLIRTDEQRFYTSTADAAFISQNVYLYAAASGLNTAVLGLVNREELKKIMGLPDNEHVIYTQVIG